MFERRSTGTEIQRGRCPFRTPSATSARRARDDSDRPLSSTYTSTEAALERFASAERIATASGSAKPSSAANTRANSLPVALTADTARQYRLYRQPLDG